MIGFLSVFVKIGKGIEDCHNCDRAALIFEAVFPENGSN